MLLIRTVYAALACILLSPSHDVKGQPTSSWSESLVLKRGEALAHALKRQGLQSLDIYNFTTQAGKHLELRSLPQGARLEVTWATSNKLYPLQLTYFKSQRQQVIITRSLGPIEVWNSRLVEKPVNYLKRSFAGIVQNTLWDSAVRNDINPSLVMELTEIFAWQIDFNRELRKGDRWRFVVTEKTIEDQHYTWGPIEVAEYYRGDEVFTAIRYEQDNGRIGYFTPEGQSLRRMFLKSPMKYGYITSKFNRQRFHPILKRKVPHLGVDYGAPVGTPVYTVGDGVVTYVGWKGPSGKTIKIRHNAVYSTAYLHLSRFKKGLRRGSRVNQGQVIGYVGQTGRATGPHLHFSFYEHGRFVDPLSRKFPSADPIAPEQLASYLAFVPQRLSLLPEWNESSPTYPKQLKEKQQDIAIWQNIDQKSL